MTMDSDLLPEHVLIVEDDPGVALLEQRCLEHAGYGVVRAASGEEALKRLGEHPKASAYSLARVILAQAEIACFQKRWDDAEAA